MTEGYKKRRAEKHRRQKGILADRRLNPPQRLGLVTPFMSANGILPSLADVKAMMKVMAR